MAFYEIGYSKSILYSQPSTLETNTGLKKDDCLLPCRQPLLPFAVREQLQQNLHKAERGELSGGASTPLARHISKSIQEYVDEVTLVLQRCAI